MTIRPKIISIAAVSGGGKTTITKKLSHKLKNSKELFFDDYDFEDSPEDLINWVKEGSDYNQWNLEPMLSDIDYLINSKEAPSYILLDYPFSYKNDRMKKLIDLSIYIDTPLDIAMARRLIRDYKNNTMTEIHNDLSFYLKYGRIAYLEMETTIKPNSDAVIDGTFSPDKIVEFIIKEIRDRAL
ncbi:AAA family ATPase [Bacillus cereus]|uniref:AAA family ATPase n=1 Tax=Bacillus TaxID=1386 RepID=UPI000557CD7F|nr:AAA family ATPase [Bacillus sp. UNC322MFChir4.1]